MEEWEICSSLHEILFLLWIDTIKNCLKPMLLCLGLVVAVIVISPVSTVAQGVDLDLSKQLLQLQAQVKRLDSALQRQPEGAAVTTQQTTAEGDQGTEKKQSTPGVPEGKQIRAGYQNCAQCHQSRPLGTLPPSHLEALIDSIQGGPQPASAQELSGAGMGQTAQGGRGMQGMSGGKGMGMGMMNGGKGMGGRKEMGMGGGMNKGESAQDSQNMNAKSGGGSVENSTAKSAEPQMQQMQQQMQELQQQMQQIMQIQMQMQLIQMKMMQSN
jgi:mono/diheme cytochrome c family protein